jgi:hypothetical protein
LALRLGELGSPAPLEQQRQVVEGVRPTVGLVRTTFRCNQDCGVCWQDRSWRGVEAAQIERWVEDLRAAGAESLIVSGGEPTLEHGLCALVERARQIGFRSVTLETNAIVLRSAGLAARLRDAGLTAAFVSLHSGEPHLSDAITRAPGTHAHTVRGIEALLAAGVSVGLNAVVADVALGSIGALPAFLARTFGASATPTLTLSYPVAPFDRSLLRTVLPEPTALRRALTQAVAEAAAVGVELRGLDGPCGPPLCAFVSDAGGPRRQPVPEPVGFRQHLPACAPCAVRVACFGVSRAAVDLYGESCVRPIGRELPETEGA